MKLSENFGEISSSAVISEGITKEQLTSAMELVGILEKLLQPVAPKMPKTMAGMSEAKKIIRASMSKDVFTRLAGKITPNVLKPFTKFNEAIGFMSALAQGLVQSSQVYTMLGDVQTKNVDTPIGNLMDKTQLFKELQAAMTPDGFLGFMRGLPLVSAADIAREMMGLSYNEFKAITHATEELKAKKKIAQSTGSTAKEINKNIKHVKQTKETVTTTKPESIAKEPTSPEKKISDTSTANPKMMAFSRKKYASALYTAVKKIISVSEKQVEDFIGNIANILEKQKISIAETKRLGSMFGGLLHESLSYEMIAGAASAAGINDENAQAVLAYKLAKMISNERITKNSGALPKVFPEDFKISVPAKKALEIINAKEEEINSEFWKSDKAAQQKQKDHRNESLTVMTVTNPYGLKGRFIPLSTRNPVSDGIVVQGRDPEQENKGDDYEYDESSNIWYIDIEKLMRNIKKQTTAQTESVPEEEQKTVVQDRKK